MAKHGPKRRGKEPHGSAASDEFVLLRQIRQRFKVLDDDEFGCLFDACHHAADPDVRIHARALIAYSNLGLVISLARRFAGRGVPLADLVHEGLISIFTDGIDKFRPERGYKFSTYATCWIHQAVTRLIDNTGGLTPMRLPVHAMDELRSVNKAQSLFRKAHGREPGFDELLDAVHGLDGKTAKAMTPKRLKNLLNNEPGHSVSLDAPFGPDEDGRTLVEHLGSADSVSDPAVFDALDELRLHVNGLRVGIDALRDSWRRIVAMRYGWFGDPAMSLVRIGERCSLSRERIRQIVQQSLAIIGRKLHEKPRQVDELLTIIGDIWDGPLLTDRSSTPGPEPGATLDGGVDAASLEDHFTILSEHAQNWRERGEFIVFAPVPTLLARERFSTLDGAKKCVEAFVAKGWAQWARGMDAVRLRRFDKVPAPKEMRRSNKRLHWLKRHGLEGKRTAFRLPSPAQVLSFLNERAAWRGNKRVARPAVTLLCVQFRLEPQAAVRLLNHLQDLGAVASSDEWKSVIMLRKRLPKRPEYAQCPTSASRARGGPRERRDSEVRLLHPGAARQAAVGAGEQRGRRRR
jgi:RNA polymerase sigma factor (sigma-70 family)